MYKSNTSLDVIKSFGFGIVKFADCMTKLRPDIIIVVGDRIDVLVPVQVAACC